ncbi:hypothetical protein BHE74_00041778 [Ensete ventricosum]|nr:hypothetical protein BHE74_00041778 [Ensete ventricosum]
MTGVNDTAYLKIIAVIILCNPRSAVFMHRRSRVELTFVCRADGHQPSIDRSDEREGVACARCYRRRWGCDFLGLDWFPDTRNSVLWRPHLPRVDESSIHELPPGLDSTTTTHHRFSAASRPLSATHGLPSSMRE